MAKRTVVHALYSWTDEDGLPRMALRGEEVELGGKELERAERFGAVVEGDLPAAEGGFPEGGPVVAPVLPVDPAEAGKLLDEKKPAARKPAAGDKG